MNKFGGRLKNLLRLDLLVNINNNDNDNDNDSDICCSMLVVIIP